MIFDDHRHGMPTPLYHFYIPRKKLWYLGLIYYQEKIYEFLGLKAVYDENKRNDFFSPTASTRQVKEGVHKRSIDKKEFSHHKAEFLDAVLMQREYWAKKDIKLKNNDFFGYSLILR